MLATMLGLLKTGPSELGVFPLRRRLRIMERPLDMLLLRSLQQL